MRLVPAWCNREVGGVQGESGEGKGERGRGADMHGVSAFLSNPKMSVPNRSRKVSLPGTSKGQLPVASVQNADKRPPPAETGIGK